MKGGGRGWRLSLQFRGTTVESVWNGGAWELSVRKKPQRAGCCARCRRQQACRMLSSWHSPAQPLTDVLVRVAHEDLVVGLAQQQLPRHAVQVLRTRAHGNTT